MPKKWRGQTATLQASGGNLTTDPFGVLQDVTVTPAQDVSELRGAGDVRWVDIMRTSVSVEISGTIAAWDLETWDVLVDFDEAAGGFGPSEEVPTYDVTVGFESSDGSTKDITAGPAYMDPPPEIGGSRDEWVNMDLTMTAKEVTNISNTDGSV